MLLAKWNRVANREMVGPLGMSHFMLKWMTHRNDPGFQGVE